MKEQGWIRIYRKITQWEWYDDANTFRVFFHILINANHEDGRWRGYEVKRGQWITSVGKVAKELKISVSAVRVSLNHLKMTNEVTSEGHSSFTLLTALKYNDYQTNDKPNDKRVTNERQTSDNKQEGKEYKKEKKEEERGAASPSRELLELGTAAYVRMGKEEYSKLCQKFGGRRVDKAVQSFENYVLSKGKQKAYKDHYRTLLNWIPNEKSFAGGLRLEDFREADFPNEAAYLAKIENLI